MNTPIDRNSIGDGPLTPEQAMYRENILDHYREPHNHGVVTTCDTQERGLNPLCGDEITVYLKLSKDQKKVTDIHFSGHGCAISQAAMSMLSDEVKNKPISKIMSWDKEKVLALLGIPLSIVRIKCATLSLRTVQKALQKRAASREQRSEVGTNSN